MFFTKYPSPPAIISIMSRFSKLLIVSLIALPLSAVSQTDQEFWFVAPAVTYQTVAPSPTILTNLNRPIALYFTTAAGPATVKIEQPANPSFTPIIKTVNNFTAGEVILTSFLDSVENKPANRVINRGLHITSDKPVTATYEVQSVYNAATYTLDGRNALGTEFLIPSQFHAENYRYTDPPSRNVFDIVATEDSTFVTIIPSHALIGHAAQDTFSVMLNRGQTWSGRAASGDSTEHLGGTFVFSNNPVAVTITDDAVSFRNNMPARFDIVGDQLIPSRLAGNDFVIADFGVSPGETPGTKLIVYAFDDSTAVTCRDTVHTITKIIDRGNYAEFSTQYDSLGSLNTGSAVVHSDKPVELYSFSGTGGFGGLTQAYAAMVPPMWCSGSKRVSFTSTPPYGFWHWFDIFVVARNGSQGSFSGFTFNGWVVIPGTNGEYIRSGAGFVIPMYSTITIANSKANFQVSAASGSWTNDTAQFAKFSYFSDFSALYLGPDKHICPGDETILDAGFGHDSYLWSTGDTTQTIRVKFPGTYWVQVTEDNCILSDTIVLSYYWNNPVNLGPDRQICAGDTIELDAGPGRAWYYWSTGDSTRTIRVSDPGEYWVQVPDVHCTVSDTVIVTISPPPVVTNDPLTKTICTGESTGIVLASSAPSAFFTWTASLTSGTVTGFSADSGLVINQVLTNLLPTPGVVTYHITPKLGNCTGTPSDFTVTVFPGDSVKVSISASTNNVCAGTPVTFTATSTNGGTNPLFTWKVNGSTAGTNNAQYTYPPANGDVVECMLTSADTVCVSNNPATSNQVLMVIDSLFVVNCTIAASSNPVCEGAPVTITATPVNGGSSPVFQWKVNGMNVGINSPDYTYVPLNNDQVNCIFTSSESCTTNNPITTNTLSITTNSNLVVGCTITASQNPICSGLPVTITAHPVNGGSSPSFLWKVNGATAGSNNPVFIFVPSNGDLVSCAMTSSETCTTNNPVNSDSLLMVIDSNLTVICSISASANPVCAGTSVTFTATPTHGGLTPSYLWKVNGSSAGTNNPVYTYIPANGDQVTCTLTSSEPCTVNNPVNSNSLLMVIDSNLMVVCSISASANPVCAGTSVTFTAAPTHGGLTPSYLWKVNGSSAGTNNPVYTYVPANGDQVSCTLTSSEPCTVNNPVNSNSLLMVIDSVLVVNCTIAASINPVCAGLPVTFTATPVNGGTSPSYQWKVNGINAGPNNPLYTFNPSNGDLVNCTMTSSETCTINNPITTNTLQITTNNPPAVTFTPCFDTITTTNAKPILLRGGIPLGGVYSCGGCMGGFMNPPSAGVGTHVITYAYTNAALCSASAGARIHVFSAAPFTCGSTLTDIRDGTIYPTIQIGTQCWMAANLNFGIPVPSTQYQRDNCIPERYKSGVGSQESGVYQWDELMNYDDIPVTQGLCPPGWHVPAESDWNTLFSNWGSNGYAGSPLKYDGYSGFNALLVGVNHQNRQWDFADFATLFWSSTSHGPYKAWSHGLNEYNHSVSFYPSLRSNAFSVRCLRDF
jgi:uncharacterized protein (TIGR02145 family)